MHNSSIGVELLCCVTAVIRKLFDQVFVSLTKLVFRAIGNGESLGTEMFQQIFQQPIREPILICPGTITKNTLQLVNIGIFHLAECLNNGHTNIFGYSTDIIPVIPLWNHKGMDFISIKFSSVIAILFDSECCFFIVYITDALEEQQRKNILFIGTSINVGS